MMCNYKITIALCTYNGEKYLSQQLASFKPAFVIFDDIELIIADDCSNDSTNEIIEGFIEYNPSFQIKYIKNSKNVGVTKNFENIIKLAKGDYIYLSDQDDIWNELKFTNMLNLLISSKKKVAFSDAVVINNENKRISDSLWEELGLEKKEINKLINDDYMLAKKILKRDIVTGCTMLIEKNFLRSCLPLSSNFIHDTWIANLAALSGKLLMVDQKMIQYRIHESQEIGLGKKNNSLQSNFSTVIEKNSELLSKISGSKEYVYQELLDKKYQFFISREKNTLNSILKNILNKNYFTYSKGGYSIVKDLINLKKGGK